MNIIFTLIGLILIADFISGIGHWFEDAYGNPNWKFLGDVIIKPNLEHHSTPRSFIARSYWSRNNASIILCATILLLSLLSGFYSWQLLFVLIYLSQVNELHACSHRRPTENFKLVLLLQKIGLIQSNLHHGWHHKAPYNCNYCILTAYLNPVLDKIGLWYHLEKLIQSLFGISPLRGSEIRNGI